MYEAIVTLHILSGMAWVGGGIVFLWGAHNIRSDSGHAAAIEMWDRLEKATTALTLTPFLVIGTGIAQVLMSEQHDWSHLWIILALVLVVAALGLASVNDARLKKAQRRAEEAGNIPTVAFDRSIRSFWVELLILGAIVTLMVTKPL